MTFSQQFCSLARCGAGGRVVTGRRARNCLVQVADGKLVIVMAPSVLLASVLAPMVEILTSPALRTIGTSVVLWLGGLDDPLLALAPEPASDASDGDGTQPHAACCRQIAGMPVKAQARMPSETPNPASR